MLKTFKKKVNKILIAINIIVLTFLIFILNKTNQNISSRPTITSSYYIERQTLFDNLPESKNTIFFLGDSLTDGCEWSELLSNSKVQNRGISGDSTQGVLNRLVQITKSKPQKIFLMIGINDLLDGVETDIILDNYQKIITNIKNDSPKTKIYIESVLPLNFGIDNNDRLITNQNISSFNEKIKDFADNSTVFYIDLYKSFIDLSEQLDSKYTLDGIHLNGKGYLNWKNQISIYLK